MSIRLASLIHDSIVDGEGLRSVVFTQGCPHNCKGCHNAATQPFDQGMVLDIDVVIQEILDRNHKKVTFSGGEPFVQADACYTIAKKLKEHGYSLWSYTGFDFEVLMRLNDPYIKKFLSTLDILIDGRFILEKRNLTILFRGSSNQRIIDVPASLKANAAIISSRFKDPVQTNNRDQQGIYL